MPPGRLHLYRSNRTERLVEALADVLRTPTGDGFSRDIVVVHSKGLERWLAMQLAQALDICANVDFVFPSALLNEAIEALDPELDVEAWSADRMRWSVYTELSERIDDPRFAQVARWVRNDGDRHAPRRLLDLSGRLAVQFERYATYRAHDVATWTTASDDWQQVLWAGIQKRIEAPDPAAVARWFMDRLGGDDVDLGDLPGRISVFSVSTLPPLELRMLGRLARHREVYLFALSPSPALTGAVLAERDSLRDREAMPSPDELKLESRHPLMASMGALARDFHVALETIDPPYDEPLPDLFEAPGEDTLLHALQSDLFHDRIGQRDREPDHPVTLRVHACHGPMRQVQVLRDVLLQLLDDDTGLQPRDILVMTPDIETYAPLVAAVFSDGERWEKRDRHPGGLPAIPYKLADRGPQTTNPAAAALLRALRLIPGRLETSEVLDLLSMPAVRSHVGIAADHWTQVRTWIAESGARWGVDRDHRASEQLPTTDIYTWRFALDRMLLGQALLDPESLVLNTAPVGDIEGGDQRALLAGLVGFGETLLAHRSALGGDHDLPTWRDRLFALSTSLVGEKGWRVQAVRDGLNELVDTAMEAGFAGRLDLEAIRGMLEGRFTVSTPGRGYLAGGITFCQLVPMRSIPYRVVCLLGMDDGAFPRMATRPGFDAIAADPLLGDRASRADDRGLFLESLLSARDRIEILYTGRGSRDNEVQPPAVPVGELLDALDMSFSTGELDPETGRELPVSKKLTVHHALQPFSPEPFAVHEGEIPMGFDQRMYAAAEAWLDGLGQQRSRRDFLTQPFDPPEHLTELRLTHLIRFLQHPVKWFCERRLGVWMRDDEDPVADREPVKTPNALQQWALLDQMVSAAISERPLNRGGDLHLELLRGAKLPLGTPGNVLWDRLAAQAIDIATRYTKHLNDAPFHVDVDLEIDGLRLVERVFHCHSSGRVTWRAGRVREKYALDLWVRHLALAAMGHHGQSHMFGRGNHAGFDKIEADAARTWLTQLVELYHAGQGTPLLFFPATSAAWLEAYDGADAEPQWAGHHAAKNKWGGFDEPGAAGTWVLGPGTNPFDPRTDLGELPILEAHDIESLARTVWQPAWDHWIGEPEP